LQQRKLFDSLQTKQLYRIPCINNWSTILPTIDNAAIHRHIYGTYINLRFGMAAIAALLPALVYVWGQLNDIPLQDSMSAYYWATLEKGSPVRLWFVGGLFSIASCLYLYQGFTIGENYALNIAAALAVGVAYFPMEWNCGNSCQPISAHGVCAVSLFVCLIYVTWFRSRDTLPFLSDPTLESKYRKLYAMTSIIMLASPLTAFILQSLLGKSGTYVFFIEVAGIWAFAAFWLIKSLEMRHSKLEPSGQ
jgi:hypothetical protein